MAYLEGGIVGLFALWALGSVAFALRLPGLHRVLARHNRFQTWVGWSLFNSSDPAVRPGIFEIEYRDRAPSGEFSSWTTGLRGFAWSWRICLWNPERWVADGVHHLGRSLKSKLESGAPLAALREHTVVVETCLRRQAPPPPGAEREIRVVRYYHSEGPASRQILLSFNAATHGDRR